MVGWPLLEAAAPVAAAPEVVKLLPAAATPREPPLAAPVAVPVAPSVHVILTAPVISIIPAHDIGHLLSFNPMLL